GRNQPPHDHVFLQTAQVIDAAGDRGLSEHTRGLLERRSRDEGVSRERSLRDTQQQRLGLSHFAVFLAHALVLILEAETIDLLFEQKLRVADFLDLHPAQHLPDNHFDVLVVDVYTLQTIDLLDFVYEVFLQTTHTQNSQNVVRVEWSIHERFAGTDAVAILLIDVRTT